MTRRSDHKSPPASGPAAEGAQTPDARLVERARQGDSEASYRFFHDHYPAIHRYLLWLVEERDLAEDLAQETFVRAWRHLDTFDGRGTLRAWLHAIAHREFLRALRTRRAQASLDTVGETPAPEAGRWQEAVELRELLRKLPEEEREMVTR